MRVRPMDRIEGPLVRELFALAHPGWPQPPEQWFFAYPTLVAVTNGLFGQRIVGYTVYSMNMTDAGVLTMMGQDTGVHPSARGAGLSRVLMDARLDIARSLGAKMFAGVTAPDNVPMRKLLESYGMRKLAVVPGHFKHDNPPRDGIVYALDLEN